MTVTSAITSTYEHKSPLRAPKNKANFKPRDVKLQYPKHTIHLSVC